MHKICISSFYNLIAFFISLKEAAPVDRYIVLKFFAQKDKSFLFLFSGEGILISLRLMLLINS